MNSPVYKGLQKIVLATSTLITIVAPYLVVATTLCICLATAAQAATIRSATVEIDPSNDTVRFSFNTFGVAEFKRAYIDADQNIETGHCGGYEFLIENGEIYDFAGENESCDWMAETWEELCQTFADGDREDRTYWTINAQNLNNISVGASVNFEVEGLDRVRTSLKTTVQIGDVPSLEPRRCEPAPAPPDSEITKAAVRVDSSSHSIEIDFESEGEYENKLVLIDTDNNPQTGHRSHLARNEDEQGYDLLIDNGYVRVFAGNHGSDKFEWQVISTADQNVGTQSSADNLYWTINTCEIEKFLPPIEDAGAVMFVLQVEHDNLATDGNAFETSVQSFDSGQTITCPGVSDASRLLADDTAANLYRRLGRSNNNQFFSPQNSDSDTLALNDFGLLSQSDNFSDSSSLPASVSGGGAFCFLLPILGLLCAFRCKRTGNKRHFLRNCFKLIVLLTVSTGIANAQGVDDGSEEFVIQFTEPLPGKFWIDVGGASNATERKMMEALLSSALVKLNDSIWNGLDQGLPIRVKRCDGQSNAYYDAREQEIVLCWELYDAATQVYARFINQESPQDFARGFLIFVLYHELAHALVDLRELPDVGNQESNADALATVFSVEQGYAPFAFIAGLLFRATGETTFGAIHPGGTNRSGNIICWVTGGDLQSNDLTAYGPYKEIFNSLGRDCVSEYQANRQLILDVFPDFID